MVENEEQDILDTEESDCHRRAVTLVPPHQHGDRAPPEALPAGSLSPAWEARLAPLPQSSSSTTCFSLHGRNMENKSYSDNLTAKQTCAFGNPGGFNHR